LATRHHTAVSGDGDAKRRQPNAEDRAAVSAARDLDTAAVQFGQALHQRKPEPGALVFPGEVALDRIEAIQPSAMPNSTAWATRCGSAPRCRPCSANGLLPRAVAIPHHLPSLRRMAGSRDLAPSSHR